MIDADGLALAFWIFVGMAALFFSACVLEWLFTHNRDWPDWNWSDEAKRRIHERAARTRAGIRE